jgi:hypothetical protein
MKINLEIRRIVLIHTGDHLTASWGCKMTVVWNKDTNRERTFCFDVNRQARKYMGAFGVTDNTEGERLTKSIALLACLDSNRARSDARNDWTDLAFVVTLSSSCCRTCVAQIEITTLEAFVMATRKTGCSTRITRYTFVDGHWMPNEIESLSDTSLKTTLASLTKLGILQESMNCICLRTIVSIVIAWELSARRSLCTSPNFEWYIYLDSEGDDNLSSSRMKWKLHPATLLFTD